MSLRFQNIELHTGYNLEDICQQFQSSTLSILAVVDGTIKIFNNLLDLPKLVFQYKSGNRYYYTDAANHRYCLFGIDLYPSNPNPHPPERTTVTCSLKDLYGKYTYNCPDYPVRIINK